MISEGGILAEVVRQLSSGDSAPECQICFSKTPSFVGPSFFQSFHCSFAGIFVEGMSSLRALELWHRPQSRFKTANALSALSNLARVGGPSRPEILGSLAWFVSISLILARARTPSCTASQQGQMHHTMGSQPHVCPGVLKTFE